MQMDAATLGGVVISGKEFRARSSEPRPDPRSPGLNVTQCIAVQRKFGIVTTYAEMTFKQATNLVLSYRSLLIPGDYDQMGKWSAQPSFLDDHMMLWVAMSGNREECLIFDPLRASPRWIPVDVIKRYTEDFGKRVLGNVGKIQFAYTRRTPLVAVSTT